MKKDGLNGGPAWMHINSMQAAQQCNTCSMQMQTPLNSNERAFMDVPDGDISARSVGIATAAATLQMENKTTAVRQRILLFCWHWYQSICMKGHVSNPLSYNWSPSQRVKLASRWIRQHGWCRAEATLLSNAATTLKSIHQSLSQHTCCIVICPWLAASIDARHCKLRP